MMVRITTKGSLKNYFKINWWIRLAYLNSPVLGDQLQKQMWPSPPVETKYLKTKFYRTSEDRFTESPT